jgi:acetyl esterase/lipase
VDVTLEVWPEMPHVWQLFGGFLPEADAAIERIAAFLRAH